MNIDFKSNKVRAFGTLILLLIIGTFLFRACSGHTMLGEKIYYIGQDNTWYPIDFRGKDQNMVGFVDEVFRAIGEEENFEVVIYNVPPSLLYEQLARDDFDAVVSSLVPNIVQKQRYEFSSSFYPLGPVLVVRQDSTVKSLLDLSGRIIGIEAGASQHYEMPEDPLFVIIPYDSISSAFENLDKRVIDGVIADVLRAYPLTQGYYNGKLKVVSGPLLDEGLRLAVTRKPKESELIKSFDAGLKKIKENGTYDKLLKKWDIIKTEK